MPTLWIQGCNHEPLFNVTISVKFNFCEVHIFNFFFQYRVVGISNPSKNYKQLRGHKSKYFYQISFLWVSRVSRPIPLIYVSFTVDLFARTPDLFHCCGPPLFLIGNPIGPTYLYVLRRTVRIAFSLSIFLTIEFSIGLRSIFCRFFSGVYRIVSGGVGGFRDSGVCPNVRAPVDVRRLALRPRLAPSVRVITVPVLARRVRLTAERTCLNSTRPNANKQIKS